MARKPTQMQAIRALIDRLEPSLRDAFEAAVGELYAGIQWQALLSALEAGNTEAAVAALNIDPGAFQRFATVKGAAFTEGGAVAAATIVVPGGTSVPIRFDLASPTAQEWISENVADRIVQLSDEAKLAVRDTIASGYDAGRNPLDIARDIAGRSTRGGARQGGTVGLDRPRAARLLEVSRGMETQEGVRRLVIKGDDGVLRMRYKVNAATEKRILRAYGNGSAVPEKDRILSVKQYENALLKARADTIAQTETAQAVMSGRAEEWGQTLGKIGATENDVIKTFVHGGGPKDPRPHHVAMNGHSVRGLNTPFVFSNGARLQYPCDPAAPASETIKCSCGCNYAMDPQWRNR